MATRTGNDGHELAGQQPHDAPDGASRIKAARDLPAGDPEDDGSAVRGTSVQSSSGGDGGKRQERDTQRRNGGDADEDGLPASYADDLDEVAGPGPVQNADGAEVYRNTSLERSRSRERYEHEEDQRQTAIGHGKKSPSKSRLAAEIGTIGYLIIFSFFGTLARLGLQAITVYPGAPVVFGVLWANVAGCLIMGFLSEDRMLFRRLCPTHIQFSPAAKESEDYIEHKHEIDYAAAKKAHNAAKKTTPLYIGLATGFCGSFTSFSSFIRDMYLALSNRLPTPVNHPVSYTSTDIKNTTLHRNGGYSFMALIAVLILTIALSISALNFGAHLAIGLERITPRLPSGKHRRILDSFSPFLAAGLWLGAIFLSVFPPDRHSNGPEIWRGRVTFALVFAPLGVLARFYVSLWLNGKLPSFPLGTFVINVFGTVILGMCWDLQHVPLGGVVGCQVLQGVMDGFCGCATTVSTWVSELVGLRRRHAYRYGLVSVLVPLAFLVVIMGSMQWTRGFSEIACNI